MVIELAVEEFTGVTAREIFKSYLQLGRNLVAAQEEQREALLETARTRVEEAFAAVVAIVIVVMVVALHFAYSIDRSDSRIVAIEVASDFKVVVTKEVLGSFALP